ncbi:ribosome 60S biogenesis N-terminal-domain-containing protein [Coniochaeta sp. 2T2.1]|nr:ribosome 60S biogenesis N-terminal-domain-containing protein [Coniochaeta sp. 2T2.1]
MGKRSSMGGGAAEKPRKRVKVIHEAPSSEEIHTSRQLQGLLAPEQDLKKARHGLQSFKVFLDHINNGDEGHEDQRQILDEYLASTKPRADEENPVYLPDIMENWSYAGQTNNDNILSAVPVVLALLLRILSHSLEQVPYGLGICRTLLQKRQQELIARNLSADKGKEFIISPTLRLLREALMFDGGAIAKPIFRARSSTFKSLGRNMGIKYLGEGREDPKRPSARTNAVRFFLSALKFLHPEAKKELLSLKDIVTGLTRSIRDDPPHLILETLDTLKTQVLLDDKVPREAKSKLLSSNTLTRISSLYTYPDDSEAEVGRSVDDVAHAFLQIACTLPSAGVLRQQSGFYPRGTEVEDEALLRLRNSDDVGLENVVWMNKFRDEIPVRNYALSEFIQNLRPWSTIKQSELLIEVFKAAPELIADYFQKKRAFTFEPKLSATWIGYAALLFSAVQVEIPEYFGQSSGYSHFPPPTSIVLDNILPLPLNQKVLVRCLAQKSNLISFFVTRILVLSLEKLDTTLKLYREAAYDRPLWKEAARRLVDEFCQRCPPMKDIVNSYRAIPEDNILHREAASRLLLRYYEVLPQVALIAKFDVSPFLVTCIKRLGVADDDQSSEDKNLGLRELEHLLVIAGHSPGMRWFAKLEGLTLSPFLTLLQLLVDSQEDIASEKLFDSINFVAEEQQVVLPQEGGRGLTPLVQSLRLLKKTNGSDESTKNVWAFIDNCVTRCATAPIKYLEMMLDLIESKPEGGDVKGDVPRISPLTMALLEQIPFALKTKSPDTVQQLAKFVNLFLACSKAAGEDAVLLEAVFGKLRSHFPEVVQKKTMKKFPAKVGVEEDLVARVAEDSKMGIDSPELSTQKDKAVAWKKSLEELFVQPVEFEFDNSALHKWANKGADDLVEEGYAASLVTLLASEHTSIRKEAVTNILKTAAKIQQSDYDEKEQSHLLLCELAETAKGNVDTTPLPSSIVSFACHGLEVLKNPLHTMYAKVNSFLTSGPVWKLEKLPLVHEILQEEPSEDDCYYAELSWLLSYLLDSLRTPTDLALFHKKRVFEQLMSLAGNPYMRPNLRTEILGILYRATSIEGGSGTLMTRFGVMAWLESRQAAASGGDEEWIYPALIKRVWETADRERALAWSKGGIPDILNV